MSIERDSWVGFIAAGRRELACSWVVHTKQGTPLLDLRDVSNVATANVIGCAARLGDVVVAFVGHAEHRRSCRCGCRTGKGFAA